MLVARLGVALWVGVARFIIDEGLVRVGPNRLPPERSGVELLKFAEATRKPPADLLPPPGVLTGEEPADGGDEY